MNQGVLLFVYSSEWMSLSCRWVLFLPCPRFYVGFFYVYRACLVHYKKNLIEVCDQSTQDDAQSLTCNGIINTLLLLLPHKWQYFLRKYFSTRHSFRTYLFIWYPEQKHERPGNLTTSVRVIYANVSSNYLTGDIPSSWLQRLEGTTLLVTVLNVSNNDGDGALCNVWESSEQ